MAPKALPSTAVRDGVRTTFAGRRRLLQGGLGAAPVLMSVVSRPVSAGDCAPGSTWHSANTSGNLRTPYPPCNGKTPEYWSQELPSWPPSGPQPGDLFKKWFVGTNRYSGGEKLEDLIVLTDPSGHGALARHAVAALLNAKLGWTPDQILGVGKVLEIWAALDPPGGYYEPTAGIKWYTDACDPPGPLPGGVTLWMRSTMTG